MDGSRVSSVCIGGGTVGGLADELLMENTHEND